MVTARSTARARLQQSVDRYMASCMASVTAVTRQLHGSYTAVTRQLHGRTARARLQQSVDADSQSDVHERRDRRDAAPAGGHEPGRVGAHLRGRVAG